jgi:hypothetical protein
MGIRIDFSLEKHNGEKLTSIEKYELERKINIALSECMDKIVNDAIPNYIVYCGCSHKLVGHNKSMVKVLK